MSNNYKVLLTKAIKEGENRNYALSLEILLKIASETDSEPEAFLYLGRSYHATGEYFKAVQALKLYLSYNELSAKGYFFLGRTYLSLEFYVKALKCFKEALGFSPEASKEIPTIMSMMGIAYLKLKKISHSLSYLEKALLASPDDKKIYNAYLNTLYIKGIKTFRQGDLDGAEQIFKFIISTGRESSAINLYLAFIKKETGEIDEAIKLYKKVIAENPKDHLLKMQLIPLLLKTGNNSEAADIISDLTQKNIPVDSIYITNIDINRLLAIESFEKEKYKTAIFFAKNVLRENYYDNGMHLLRGEAFRHTGNLDNALNHFSLVLGRDSSKIEAIYGVIMVLWLQEQFNKLLDKLTKWKNRFPNDETIYYYYALTCCKLQMEPTQNITLLKEEINKNSFDPYLWDEMGNQFLRLSKPVPSEEFFLNSLKFKKNHAPAYIGLLKVYHILGKKSKIGSVFREYLKLFPDDNKLRRYYINYLYSSGLFKVAAKEIEKYISRYENDNILRKLLAKCYVNNNEYRKALVLYRELLKEDFENEKILISYAFCLTKVSMQKAALQLLEKYRTIIKNSISIELNIGIISYREKDYEKSLNAFRKAMEINDKDWRSYYNISKIYEKQGLKVFAKKFANLANHLKK